MLFDLGALRAKIIAEAASFAAVGHEEAAEHPQKRRLTAAVRTEETVNLAGPNLHGDVVDDGARAEFFRDAANVNDEIGRHRGNIQHSTFNPQHPKNFHRATFSIER